MKNKLTILFIIFSIIILTMYYQPIPIWRGDPFRVCGLKKGSITVNLYRYNVYMLGLNAHTSEIKHKTLLRVINKNNNNTIIIREKRSMFPLGFNDGICRFSIIYENNVYLYPIYIIKDGFPRNVIYELNSEGGRKIINIPNHGPPYIYSDNNYVLNEDRWYLRGVEATNNGRIQIEQVGFSLNYFVENEMTALEWDCREGKIISKSCSPIILRTMISDKDNIKWKLNNYKILDSNLYKNMVSLK